MRRAAWWSLALCAWPLVAHADVARVHLVRRLDGYDPARAPTLDVRVDGDRVRVEARHWVEGCAGRGGRAPRFEVTVRADRLTLTRRGAAPVPRCAELDGSFCADDTGASMPCPRASCACDYTVSASAPAAGIAFVEIGDGASVRARRAVPR